MLITMTHCLLHKFKIWLLNVIRKIVIRNKIFMFISFTLRKECMLRVFENWILRRIFGPKRDENGEWRRLHNEKLLSLYRSPNI